MTLTEATLTEITITIALVTRVTGQDGANLQHESPGT